MAKAPKVTFKVGDHIISQQTFVVFDPKKNLFFGFGNGWVTQERADTFGFPSVAILVERLKNYLRPCLIKDFLTKHQIVSLKRTVEYVKDVEIPAKISAQLDKEARIDKAITELDMPSSVAQYYRDYHKRTPENSKYHDLFFFSYDYICNWVRKLSKDEQRQRFGTPWHYPDKYRYSRTLGGLIKPEGFKYPEIQYGPDFIVFRTKVQAIQFRLACQTNHQFKHYDFKKIYDEFEAV